MKKKSSRSPGLRNALTALFIALPAAAPSSRAELIYTHDFEGGGASWQTADGETMKTGDLAEAYVTADTALAPLIRRENNDTDARSATLMAWVKIGAAPKTTNIFKVASLAGGDVSQHGGYALVADASGAVSATQGTKSAPSLATLRRKWVHVTMTLQRSETERTATVRIYLNGVLWGGAEAPADTTMGTNLDGNRFAEFAFGDAGISAARVQIYDKVLTPEEIEDEYKRQAGNVPEPSTYGLLGAGALAATALVRRRRKAV